MPWMCSENRSIQPPPVVDQRIRSDWRVIRKIMSAVNEALVRDIVSEVLGRLGGGAPPSPVPPPAPAASAKSSGGSSCGCGQRSTGSAPALRGRFGVFADTLEACAAAQESFLLLQ